MSKPTAWAEISEEDDIPIVLSRPPIVQLPPLRIYPKAWTGNLPSSLGVTYKNVQKLVPQDGSDSSSDSSIS